MAPPRPSRPHDDRLFTFTNYATGRTFSGEVSELIVFPYAMSASQAKELKRSSADRAAG